MSLARPCVRARGDPRAPAGHPPAPQIGSKGQRGEERARCALTAVPWSRGERNVSIRSTDALKCCVHPGAHPIPSPTAAARRCGSAPSPEGGNTMSEAAPTRRARALRRPGPSGGGRGGWRGRFACGGSPGTGGPPPSAHPGHALRGGEGWAGWGWRRVTSPNRKCRGGAGALCAHRGALVPR